jgi:hypothetical protein
VTCTSTTDAGNKQSSFRFNAGMNPRTQILFNSQANVPGIPNFIDGKWWISDCDEGSVTNGRDGNTVDKQTTPSVANLQELALTNSAATTVTNFMNGHIGQSLMVTFADGNTTLKNGTNIFLIGGADVTYMSGNLVLLHASLGSTSTSTPIWREVVQLPS